MVYFFTTHDTQYIIYMGRDKFENEHLLQYGWEEDVWFHVDKHSSAHVYLRLPSGKTIDEIPSNILEDCAQLVKYNSIEGNKLHSVVVVYTSWSNLKKTGDMDVGQVGFKDRKSVKTITVERRKNDIINRLEKSKREAFPNLAQEKEDHEREHILKRKQAFKEQLKAEKLQRQEQELRRQELSYSRIMVEDNMTSNKDLESSTFEEYEESFL
ncbi:Coiled-coil domain-containing protein 25 [Galdieria sulphuraria]|nr:Coiled-coil domain-containing protein 25 [Galdieria sulphuraria]